ncbi:putative DNA-binding protein [Chengkuizengella sediminis]|uniref:putative DNA-binding protein n=1 Tax=Chengkuizengella sediminis TaxID=1885917 RepID=UPI0013895E0C|nr:putative DNA-binding protein [Chengkuizengella sediminis]NDI33419.1 putative DNA-binding protein [Chengkuizengella sediminis]
MSAEKMLEKTNRINMLFDFYQNLLTEKQQTYLKFYFQDDYSLGEIAEQFQISRQAIYEHIKRAEQVLDQYESKLHLVSNYLKRNELLNQLNNHILDLKNNKQLLDITEKLKSLDET